VKFRCERDVLVEALNTAGRAASSRGGSPVLSGVRLELTGGSLSATGTDLDLTITTSVSVDGESDGVAVLPSKLAHDIVKALEPGAVTVAVESEEATIAAGRSHFSVRTIPAEEFPRVAQPGGEGVTLDAKALAEALRQVVAAASSDDSRPILTGVLMAAESEGLRLVATDSYRLAVRDLPGTSFLSEGQTVLVPSAALKELARVLGQATEVTLRLGDRDAAFQLGPSAGGQAGGGVHLTTRLIEGEFPPYRNLIPKAQPNRLTVSREGLLGAVRRVRVVASDPSTPIRLSMSGEGLQLHATAQDVGNAAEELDAKYEGTELTVAFNPEYLLAGADAATGDEVTLETIDSLKPALLRSIDSTDFLYLLMPVRVS
jgi:DNA polymerase-3 subunit beta